MFSDISFSDSHVCVDKFECQKLNFRLNKSKVAVPRCWVLPIKTERVARKGAPATLYLEILRLHNHLDGDDDGNDNDHGNGRSRCLIEGKGEVQIILQVVQLDLGSLQWQLVIQLQSIPFNTRYYHAMAISDTKLLQRNN